MMCRPRMPVVQERRELRAEIGRSGHHPLKQLLLEVPRQGGPQFDGCLPERHRCLGLVHDHLLSPEMDKFELRSGSCGASLSRTSHLD
jgi:hypothetical protein